MFLNKKLNTSAAENIWLPMLTHYRRKFFKITAFSDFNSISKHMLLTVLTCRGTCLQQIKTLNHIFEIKSNVAKRITPPAETKCHKTSFKDTGGEVRGWKRERWWGKSRRVPKEMLAEPPPGTSGRASATKSEARLPRVLRGTRPPAWFCG